MNDFFNKMQRLIAELSLARKLTMVSILVIALGSIFYVVKVTRTAAMEPLFSNLNSQDIGSIVSYLDRKGIRYELDQEQRTIRVPSTNVLNLRMELAGEGLPRYGGIGFELFDKEGFGMTEFEQRINFQRALEGELARTIVVIGEVEKARVHLVLPEKTLFTNNQQDTTASVILRLGKGGGLGADKVAAITHLVAGAVEGLTADRVTVLDSTGRLLSSGDSNSSMAAGQRVFDQKLQIERTYEKRIVDMLTPIVGVGKAVARVTANIDFTRTETTDNLVDPANVAVLSESRTNSQRTEGASGSG